MTDRNENPKTHRVVLARAPTVEAQQVMLGLHYKVAQDLVETGRLAALGEYVGLIFGASVLLDPVAIFQGLNRPFRGPGVDETIYAYVSTPGWNYTYAPPANSTEDPRRVLPPSESVFVTFVSFVQSVVDEAKASLDPADRAIDGVVLYWEWTIASRSQPSLPREHQERYRRPIWMRSGLS
jgi:hypothetical protein